MKSKSKKGFTLVELLAVIVILAVVILIAVTAVVPRMNNAKRKAFFDEALVYLKAINENRVALNDDLKYCYTISELEEKYVNNKHGNYKGKILLEKNTNGDYNYKLYLSDKNKYMIVDKYGSLLRDGYIKDYVSSTWNTNYETCSSTEVNTPQSGELTITRSTPNVISVGDTVTVAGENFYVIATNASTTTLISKYNLYVGNIAVTTIFKEKIPKDDEKYGLQSSIASGYKSSGKSYATVAFSSTNYWMDGDTLKPQYGTNWPTDIYDENVDGPDCEYKDLNIVVSSCSGEPYGIAYYLKEYKETLSQLGLSNINKIRLLTYSEYNTLRANDTYYDNIIKTGQYYWLGSGFGSKYAYRVKDNGDNTTSGAWPHTNGSGYGVRPVIEVPTSIIK